MSPSEDGGKVLGGVRGVRTFLAARDKLLCIAITVAVVVPLVAVAAQVRPSTKGLPVAEDFRMWDTKTIRNIGLSDYRGKVVFLDIMATWCVVCKEQMPDLMTLNATYGGDSFVMLSVTGDPDLNVTLEFRLMEEYRAEFSANWTFAIPVDAFALDRAYVVTGFPTTVVIDRDGLMTYRAVGRVPLETLVSQVEAALNA
jgi:thiol-disulfide isomerase/thioredoxin